MIPIDVLLLFVAASAALAISPGPDNLFVLTQSAMHGRKAGVCVTLGLCTGLLVHIAAVALGVAALLATSTLAFTALKLVGAAYLLYLAWQAFRAGAQTLASGGDHVSARSLYLRGILMNVTNPKVAIFFLAFLPQFVDPARGASYIQLITLGLVFMVTAFVIFSGIAWGASRIGTWLMRSAGAQVAINRLAGTVFVLLACRLALSRQA
ncbi:MAG: LysE family translocator [Moraxellaceae bacterium]|nr:LysE family translocator [Moraxellaceae bacterium]